MMRQGTITFVARTILAIALAYVLVLKVVFAPFTAGHQPGFGVPGLDLVICSATHAESGAPTPDSGDRSACCDEGCLQRLLGFAAPLLAFVAIVFATLTASGNIETKIRRRFAGPPWRIASSPGAQRAPPFCLV